MCPLCGGDREICGDADCDWYPIFGVCEVTMAREGILRLYALEHEEEPYHDGWRTSWSAKPSPDHPFKWSDGLTIGLSPVDPGEDANWLTARAATSSSDR